MRPRTLRLLMGLAAVLGPIALVKVLRAALSRPASVFFSQFLQDLRDGKVERVMMGQDCYDVILKPAAEAGGRRLAYQTASVPVEGGDVGLVALMEQAKVQFAKAPKPMLGRVLGLMLALIPIIYLGASYKLLTKALNPDDSKSTGKKSTTAVRERVRFADVAGIDSAKAELEEIVDFLSNPAKYQAMGARIPKGVLLSGPSGTGKTLMAKALASEAGVPFMFCSASDFVEMLVGRGAARVRDLFEEANAVAPCIVFIDELDALAKARGGLNSNDEREQTLNQLLTEMDGFQHSSVGAEAKPVIVVAATNRPEVLDPALVRPGRFDRHVRVGLPDEEGRLAILKIHTRSMRLAGDVDLASLAADTEGFAGAHLANVTNEAAMLAVRKGQLTVGQRNFQEAVGRVGSMTEEASGEEDVFARLLQGRGFK